VQGAILTAAANYMDLTTNQTVATGIKTFTALPQSSAVPTLGNELVNKTFTDATYVDFVNNETIGGIKTFTNAIVATQIEGPTNTDITIEGKGTGDVILKTGSTNRITCTDSGGITIAGSSGQPMNITTTGIMQIQSASSTALYIANNQISGELNLGTATTRTGTINIGTGADSISAKTINIGNSTGAVGALNLKTRTITVGGSNCVSISADGTTNSILGTTVNIKTTGTGGTLSMGTAMTSGNIDIGTADSSTTTFNIGTGTGTRIMNIGGTATTLNLGTTAVSGQLTSLNWGTSSNSGQLSFRGGSFTFNSTGVYTQGSGNTYNTSIDSTKTTGEILIGSGNAQTGKIDIGTGTGTKIMNLGGTATTVNLIGSSITCNTVLPTSTLTPSLGSELVTKNFTDATYVDFVNNETIGGIKTFTSVPECATGATTANQLVNLTTLNSEIATASTAYAKLASANAFTSTNTFNSFLPTSTLTPSLGSELVTKTFTDATYVDFVNNETIGGIKTFTSVPECATSATTANQLVNKTTLDTAITTASTAYAKLASANAFTSTNTFNSFLPTSTLTPTLGTELVTKTFTDATYVDFVNNETIGGIKTFTSVPECATSATTGNQLVNKTFTDATYVDFVNNETIGGIKTFTSVPECATSATTGNQLVNKTFTDATYVDFVNNETIGGIKTFTSLPECSAVPSTGNQLVNKTFTDANYVDFTNTETISGAKTFSSTSGITIKNGVGAQTGTIAQDLTTLTITGVTGDVSIKPALDFNVVTGTGKNVSISAPSSASLSSTMTLSTGTSNASSYIQIVTPGLQLNTKASQPALLLSGAFTTANAWLFYRDGTATSAINRMDSRNAGDTCHLEVAQGSNIVLTQNTSTFNSDVRLIQTTIPATVDTQLGYSVLATATEFTFTAGTVGNMQTLALPSKGVWLVISNISTRTTGGAGTVQNRLLCVSTANNNTTSIGTLRYFEELDDSVGSNAIRFVETLTGVVTVTTATNIYVNGLFNTGSVTVLGTATSSFTRIG
jgi:phosphoserine aminotransferase